MRQHPVGTGPFKFVEFKPNESIRLARNPEYWKPGRPYLDGIEYTISPNRSTAILAFTAGKFDVTFPYEVTVPLMKDMVPLMKDIKSQAPQAVCDLVPSNASTNLLVNREAPPFDNPDLRRALALALDRKSFIDILAEGQGDIGGAMLPPPAEVWGMPPDVLATIPGYGPDVAKNRGEARAIMERLGYGPDKRLAIKVAAQHPDLSRPGDHPDRPAQTNRDRRASSIRSRPLNGFPSSPARTTRSASTTPAAGSTTPTSNSLRITAAARSATTPAIAMPSWKNGSSNSRRRPTATSAGVWSGTSTSNCRRTARARSSITPVLPPACSRKSKG
jgi:hypothetical protein